MSVFDFKERLRERMRARPDVFESIRTDEGQVLFSTFYENLSINNQSPHDCTSCLHRLMCRHTTDDVDCKDCQFNGEVTHCQTSDKCISQFGAIIHAFIVPIGTESIHVFVGGEHLFTKQVDQNRRVELCPNEVIPHLLIRNMELSVEPVDVTVESIMLGDCARLQMEKMNTGIYEQYRTPLMQSSL